MKAKIKALKGEMVILQWKLNGCNHTVAGKVKKLQEVKFDFLINGESVRKIRYDSVTNIELIK